jgi:hypothetical protein
MRVIRRGFVEEEESGASVRVSERRACAHEWEYMERKPAETYTGYCERCVKCGEIVQIPQ